MNLGCAELLITETAFLHLQYATAALEKLTGHSKDENHPTDHGQ